MTRKPLLGAAPRIPVLREVSFDLPRGALVGIVGGSGSGKSTLARALMRLLEPSRGSVAFDGTDITHLNEAALRPMRRRFQMIFQDPMSSLNPRRRVGAIVGAPLAVAGPGRRARPGGRGPGHGRAPARLCAALSARAQRRPAPARRHRARPWRSGPISFWRTRSPRASTSRRRRRSWRCWRGWCGDLGLTLAFISHDLAVVRRIASRVMVMEGGRIVEDRATEALFADPQAEATRALLEAIPLPDPDQPWGGLTAPGLAGQGQERQPAARRPAGFGGTAASGGTGGTAAAGRTGDGGGRRDGGTAPSGLTTRRAGLPPCGRASPRCGRAPPPARARTASRSAARSRRASCSRSISVIATAQASGAMSKASASSHRRSSRATSACGEDRPRPRPPPAPPPPPRHRRRGGCGSGARPGPAPRRG